MQKKVLAIAALFVAVFAAVVGLRVTGKARGPKHYSVRRDALTLPTDTAALHRGEHLALALGRCAECHGADFGGKIFLDDPSVGRLIAPNLTRGRAHQLSDRDMAAAIRDGVAPDGRALLFMPSTDYHDLSRADLAALVAYLRQRPPVSRTIAAAGAGSAISAANATGELRYAAAEIDHARRPVDSVAPAVSAAYGKYLAQVGGCMNCHGAQFTGGHVPATSLGYKRAPDITHGGIPDWTSGDFKRLLREGVTPRGTMVDSVMPYRSTRLLTDDEIEAIWLYLRSVPAAARATN